MKKTSPIIKPGLTREALSLMEKLEKKGITRRDFLKYTAGTAALAGLGPGLLGCSSDGGGTDDESSPSQMESRIFVFNLSHMDTTAHDLMLVAGNRIYKLSPTTWEVLDKYRNKHPILRAVPDNHATHHIELEMPAKAVQLCYIKRIHHLATDGRWDMAMLFYYLPSSALLKAQEIRMATMGATEARVPVKWANYDISPADRAELSDPVGENSFKDTNDQATAMVASHPETASGDPDSAAHIQTNIIATQPSTGSLATMISMQGPATPDGGWATLTPLMDPNTGKQAVNTQTGDLQYIPIWSDLSSKYAGQAIGPALTSVKNDTTLGADITDINPVEVTTGLGATETTKGTIWALHDGMPTVDQTASSEALQEESGFDYKFTDQSPGNGYSVKVTEVEKDSMGRIQVSIEVKNWFVRYLGLYVRFLDPNGDPILVKDLSIDIDEFPLGGVGLNGDYDILADLVEPQFCILGMPVKTKTIAFTFAMPEEASSVMVLSGGLGRGSTLYPDTINAGLVMTVLFNIAIPSLFLALAAAPGLVGLKKDLEDMGTLLWVLEMAWDFFEDTFKALTYDNPSAFTGIAVMIGQKLLANGAEKLDNLIAQNLMEGESIEAMENAFPLIGTFLAAISAIGTIAELTETSCQVAQSPKTYVSELSFTHDIEVTIYHDPDDPAGFPAVATHYMVTAIFDNGTPHTITKQMPGGTVTAPVTATFTDIPLGGLVTVLVGFYSDNEFLAGQGSHGPIFNTSTGGALPMEITIKEYKVPLTPDTVYSHKEVIVLDDQGNHQWEPTTTPPSEQIPSGCNPTDGQLCALNNITISTANASVGYTWKAYNSAVTNCKTGSISQLNQFANISITEDPQSEYLFSGCGFSGPVRTVYDLLGKQDHNFYIDPTEGKNLVRQIRLSGGTASFDGPESNKTWGKLTFDSDALLLHPAGRLISINEAANKIELLTLPTEASPDDEARQSQVYSGTGIREGLVNGPTLAALDPDGTILILETRNNRIQAFDLGANPVPKFEEGAYYVPLIDQPTAYLDLAVEYTGYMYVLSYTGQSGTREFRLDIYTPAGSFLASTPGFTAARLAVNYWRDIFALNYQLLKLPNGSLPERTEPSVSHWIPST